MKRSIAVTALAAAGLAAAALGLSDASTSADTGRRAPCSTRMVAGSWFFATDVGHIRKPALGVEGDITALGRLDIDRHGNIVGAFDATVKLGPHLPDVPFWGSIAVASDCTATVEFETGAGTFRRDTVAILGHDEMWGMSQDPENLWNYTMRRRPGGRGHRD